jgi:AcrR family transcriptional regulator
VSEPAAVRARNPRPAAKGLDSAKGTIYNYFSSNEELLLAVVEEACARATAGEIPEPVLRSLLSARLPAEDR